MNDPIDRYLKELSQDTRQRILSHYKEEVQEFSHLMGKLIQPLQAYIATVKVPDVNDPKYFAYGLMTKCANTLMAGFELALHGYFWEPPILLRNALEGFCIGWDIVHNPDRFKRWTAKKKFSSGDSVSKAKEINPIIGQFYGMLSNMYVHIGPENYSPALINTGTEMKLQLFGSIRKGKENIREGEVYLTLLVTFMCLQMAEICFYRYSIDLETIEPIPGKSAMKKKVSERHKKFVDKAMAHFMASVSDPTIKM